MQTNAIDGMSNHLITINENYSLEAAYSQMLKNEIRHLPVVDAANKIVGMLSDRDLLRAMRSNLNTSDLFKVESLEFDQHAKVSDYMTWPVRFVNKDSSIKVVAQRMIEEKISSFLVTDDKTVVGILTTEDCLKFLIKLLEESSEQEVHTIDRLIYNPAFMAATSALNNAGI